MVGDALAGCSCVLLLEMDARQGRKTSDDGMPGQEPLKGLIAGEEGAMMLLQGSCIGLLGGPQRCNGADLAPSHLLPGAPAMTDGIGYLYG